MAVSLSQRAEKVRAAVAELPAAIILATEATELWGDTDARTLAAWEIVENAGATVHRQSRLLAGKNRGG